MANAEVQVKKGAQVKFQVFSPKGATKGKGVVTTLPPKNAGRGENRVTVRDAAGRNWRPFVTHVTALKS